MNKLLHPPPYFFRALKAVFWLDTQRTLKTIPVNECPLSECYNEAGA